MDDEVKARLFEPYFTTKKDGGTGLGLSTVNAIVKELGGAIVVDSTRGKGTTFRIVLPAVSDGRDALQPERDDDAPVRGNGERILIIDDEYAVRNVLGLSLSHLGYAVETASSGVEGVDKYAEARGAFDLIILDMLMPGLSGEEVFARIRKMNPTARVLLVSGFSSEHVVSKILEQGGMDFIQKPFLIEVLSRKVRGCLCD
jgi:two-component system cell cycle sensor histidine kinase/response regulator CckA